MPYLACKNCGAEWGIDYGACEVCTPEEVFEKERQLQRAQDKAGRKFDRIVREIKERFVREETEQAEREYIQTLEQRRPKC